MLRRRVPIGLAAAALLARSPRSMGLADSQQPLLNAPDYTGEAMAGLGADELAQREASVPAGPPLDVPALPAPALGREAPMAGGRVDLEDQRHSQGGVVAESLPHQSAGKASGDGQTGREAEKVGSMAVGGDGDVGPLQQASRKSLQRVASAASGASDTGYSWRSTIPATAACTACLFVQKVGYGFQPFMCGALWGRAHVMSCHVMSCHVMSCHVMDGVMFSEQLQCCMPPSLLHSSPCAVQAAQTVEAM
jgi:hypothetical protein